MKKTCSFCQPSVCYYKMQFSFIANQKENFFLFTSQWFEVGLFCQPLCPDLKNRAIYDAIKLLNNNLRARVIILFQNCSFLWATDFCFAGLIWPVTHWLHTPGLKDLFHLDLIYLTQKVKFFL